MYSIIEDVIKNGEYELVVMLNKINKLWLEDNLTEVERDELVSLARTYATPENSYTENTQQIASLWEYCQELDARIAVLENGSVEPPEEWPEFIAPTGAHDAYEIGDKITFQGKKYICRTDSCVWNPLVYPQGWESVK